MHTKLPCGCSHNDMYWLNRCAFHASEDLVVSARWANDRANPPKVTVHRINGVVQVAPKPNLVAWAEQVGQEADIRLTQQQEAPCPEPTPKPTSGSDSTTSSVTTEPIDYSALLNLL